MSRPATNRSTATTMYEEPAIGERSELSDSELCQALTAGKTWAAQKIYERITDVVDAALFRRLGSREDEKDDLAQQAFERVMNTILSGQYSNRCNLRSWARLIAEHIAIDALRLRCRERSIFDRNGDQALDQVAAHSSTPEGATEARRRVQFVLSALSAVAEKHAEALVMHDFLGHDLAEISALTGVSQAAAQSRLVRGRRAVLQIIARKEQKVGAHEP